MKATGRARVCTEVKSVFVLLMALRTFAYLQPPLRYHARPLAHVHRKSYSWHCLFPGPCYTLDCVKVKYPHFLFAQVSPKPLRQCMQPEKKMIGKCEYFLSFFFFCFAAQFLSKVRIQLLGSSEDPKYHSTAADKAIWSDGILAFLPC